MQSRQNAREQGLSEILPRAGIFFQFFLLWVYQESVAQDGVWVVSVSTDRSGLCKPLFTAPVLSHDASDLDRMHS